MTNELPFISAKGTALDPYKMESVEELPNAEMYLNSLMHISDWGGDVWLSIYSYIPEVSADSQRLIALFCLET